MIITNLSFINECADTNVTGGTSWTRPAYDFSFRKKIDVKVNIDIYQNVYAKGTQNEVSYDLEAYGKYGAGTEVQATQMAVRTDSGGYLANAKGVIVSFAR
jgi:phage gp45-like